MGSVNSVDSLPDRIPSEDWRNILNAHAEKQIVAVVAVFCYFHSSVTSRIFEQLANIGEFTASIGLARRILNRGIGIGGYSDYERHRDMSGGTTLCHVGSVLVLRDCTYLMCEVSGSRGRLNIHLVEVETIEEGVKLIAESRPVFATDVYEVTQKVTLDHLRPLFDIKSNQNYNILENNCKHFVEEVLFLCQIDR
mmetsp:Transcript_22178/g.25001  ORF Transcript_22178/g.25001 Transcript_22178/m.25001 type:complete len:195 (-) Transcript_22178:109-693(-)